MRRDERRVEQEIFAAVALCALLFALCGSASAQQTGKVPRIGFLLAVPASTISSRIAAFRQGLRELSYVEGKNIVIEWRSEGKLDELAAELVRLKVDVIVSGGPPPTRFAKQATSTKPPLPPGNARWPITSGVGTPVAWASDIIEASCATS